MDKLGDNYYRRQCFFETETVPTQSQIINAMSPPLARVYFKSMNYKLKVLAGLEPPLKGGGNDWYMAPRTILEEDRAVMQPVNKKHLKMLGFDAVSYFGEITLQNHNRKLEEQIKQALLENDQNWKETIIAACHHQWDVTAREAARDNTRAILNAFETFSNIYSSSINKIEMILKDAGAMEVQDMHEKAYQKMNALYGTLLKEQATMLYDRYRYKLEREKARWKKDFISKVEKTRQELTAQIHDIKVEKLIVTEKLRKLLEYMKLSCQVYVALKERQECKKEMDLARHVHKKRVTKLQDEINLKNLEIKLAQEKERKRQEFITTWQKKMCQVVKKFQMFVAYCFNALPEHADFFLDMEKLLMLQMSDAVDDPRAESIFLPEEWPPATPEKPEPFYIFCDRGHKADVDETLCPQPTASGAALMPVVVLNKHFMYSACDNFEKFTHQIVEYVQGRTNYDKEFEDRHDYAKDVPVKVTPSSRLAELQLEGSLMQVLKEESPDVKEYSLYSCVCAPCPCNAPRPAKPGVPLLTSLTSLVQDTPSVSSGNKMDTRSDEEWHSREPKWDSYIDHVMPMKCKCRKMVKKHLKEHLPAYMRNVSRFEEPEMPEYERCPVLKVRELVRRARGKRTPPPAPSPVPSNTKDVGIQYVDLEFDFLCTCFSEDEINKLLSEIAASPTDTKPKFKIVGEDESKDHLDKSPSAFAFECAASLRPLIKDSSQVKDIFVKKECKFD